MYGSTQLCMLLVEMVKDDCYGGVLSVSIEEKITNESHNVNLGAPSC